MLTSPPIDPMSLLLSPIPGPTSLSRSVRRGRRADPPQNQSLRSASEQIRQGMSAKFIEVSSRTAHAMNKSVISSTFRDFFVANRSVDVPYSNLPFPSMANQGDAFCDFFSQGLSYVNNKNAKELPLFRSSFARKSSSTGKVVENPNLNS
jgi:hypothetical protein